MTISLSVQWETLQSNEGNVIGGPSCHSMVAELETLTLDDFLSEEE
ncbi:hypothetical protein SAMN05216226_102139 [Halovenus aranensis]|uniref:Uncharacterized protein n=1 Tax=Halovenus aranensis TaxID=890420 RepID=A0A1G8STV0_9EURY|nr:hypothetical protein SAMN05216226_102139 [Halovenus aranensis]